MQKRIGHTTERITPATFRRQTVSSLGRRDPATVAPTATLSSAIAAMQLGDSRTVLVSDDQDRLVGVFTERDVVRRVLGIEPAPSGDRPIEEFMTSSPEALRLDSSLGEALELMQRRGYLGVPLVDDDGRIAGHLDARDILEYVA